LKKLPNNLFQYVWFSQPLVNKTSNHQNENSKGDGWVVWKYNFWEYGNVHSFCQLPDLQCISCERNTAILLAFPQYYNVHFVSNAILLFQERWVSLFFHGVLLLSELLCHDCHLRWSLPVFVPYWESRFYRKLHVIYEQYWGNACIFSSLYRSCRVGNQAFWICYFFSWYAWGVFLLDAFFTCCCGIHF